jgi:hypothetical protein
VWSVKDIQARQTLERAKIMKQAGKHVWVILFLLCGCERQIPILGPVAINGYQVQGTVTDQVGNPVPNVAVLVDYAEDVLYPDTALTRRFFIQDPSTSVQAVVANWSNQVIRVLRPPQNFQGWYEVFWDGTDSTGIVPPSGIYYVEYLVGGTEVFSYSQLISGGKVAATDAKGQYTIPLQYLPVDSSSVPLFSTYDSSYVGNLLISNSIILTYAYPSHVQQVQRTLNKGQVTIINIVFH